MKKLLFIIISLSIGFLFACKKDYKTVTIFHAGSLSVPMKHLKKEFEKLYPDTKVLLESSGSRAAARKISDIHKPCDIMASADYMVIKNLLMPEFTDFNIRFATNEMAIVYNDKSKFGKEIDKKNWYNILLKDEVQYGHSDPEKDPCGYRSQLVWQLAEKYYKEKNLFKKLVSGRPIKNIRPKETDLLALLDIGVLDYIFLYRSVAIQHKLNFLELPVEINLRDNKFDSYYKSASVELIGKKKGEKIVVKGQSMVYGVTIVKNPVNRIGAENFIRLMLGKTGNKIIKDLGQTPIVPAISKEFDKIPEELKSLIKQN
jgi:molybdate/tungstate transport system substrate-binding protein